MALLISLTGTVRLQSGGRIVEERDLGGRQVRLALAYLVAERSRGVSRHALADLLWPEQLPPTWESALRSVMSKVRAVLAAVGLPPTDVLTAAFGCYQLHLPADAVVDVDAASASVRAAEAALAAGDLRTALEHAMAARATATRPFLPGEEGEWVEGRRRDLRGLSLRALDVLAEARLARGEPTAAIQVAEQAIALDPFREHSHRLLMSAHAAAGNRAEALRAYERCRRVLAEELGVNPSPDTEAAYIQLLREDLEPRAAHRSVAALPAGTPPSARLVGRDRATALLVAAWAKARDGQRQVVLLHGEAGVGKTALTLHVAATLHAQGATVLYGRCDRQSLRPYQPFAEALARYVVACPPVQLTRQRKWVLDDLARLVPEVATTVGVRLNPRRRDPETGRHHMFAAVASFLAAVAQDAPVVLVLDDLQWAELETALLLRYVVRALERAPVLLLGTYREEEIAANEAMRDELADLRREGGVERLHLEGLDESGVAALLAATGGNRLGPYASQLAPELLRQTGGNPFFLGELIAQLLQSPGTGPPKPAAVPDRVLEVIQQRLAAVSETTRRVVTAASVIGHDFDVGLLERAIGLETPVVLDALEEARRVRLVAEGTRVGQYRFVHGVVGDAIHDDLPPTRRAHLHLRVAEALEGMAEPAPARHARLAHHYVLARPAAAASRVVGYSLRAGDEAMDSLAYEQAAEHYRLAGEGAGDETVDRCHALVGLAGALRRAGRVSAARDAYLDATRLARQLGDARALATCALGLGGGGRGTSAWIADEVRIGLLEEALAALGSEESELRVDVLAELAKALYFTDQRRRRDALIEEALATARRLGRPAALVAALSASRVLRWGPDNTELRLLCAEEMVEIGDASGDLLLSLRAHLAWVPDLVEVGDRHGFDVQVARAMALSGELGQPYYRWRALAWNATRAVIDGRWAEADELHAAAMACWSEPHPDAESWSTTHRAVAATIQGRAREGIAPLRALAEAQPVIPSLRCLLAWCAANAGERDVAWAELERFAADGFTAPPLDGQWLAGVTALGEAAALLGDARPAEVVHQLLVPFDSRLAVLDAFGGGSGFLGSVSHALGVLAATIGDRDEAERRLRAAAEANARFGAAPFAARSGVALSRLSASRR